MRSTLRWFPASFAFVSRLVGRRDPVVKRHPNGLTRLEGWPHPPEMTALENARALIEARDAKERHSLLYCYEGPHLGECFWICAPSSTVGTASDSDITLTPASGQPQEEFRFQVEGESLRLSARAPGAFELNGERVHSAALVDYDELNLMGNRLLVLTVQGGK